MNSTDPLWSFLAALSGGLLALIGGGLGAAAVTAWRTSAEQKKSRRAEYLSRQLKELYGPIHFLCSQNTEIHKYSNRLHHAFSVEYAAPDKSAALNDIGRKESLKLIETTNRSMEQIIENNEKIAGTCLLITPI